MGGFTLLEAPESLVEAQGFVLLVQEEEGVQHGHDHEQEGAQEEHNCGIRKQKKTLDNLHYFLEGNPLSVQLSGGRIFVTPAS